MKTVKAVFLIILLISGGIYLLNGTKAAAAIFIVTAVYCALAAFFVVASGRKIFTDIKALSNTDKGSNISVSVEAKNASVLPVPMCNMNVVCENILTKDKQVIPVDFALGPKGKNRVDFEISSKHCGKIDIGTGHIVISDTAHLFSRKQKLESSSDIYVMPEISEVEIPSGYLDSYDMESYKYSQIKKGSDTGEVFGIRDYQEGDNPKQIHWKLSAKLDDMVVKIPSFPIENKLIVLLDNSLPEGQELDADRRSSLVEYFFSLSHALNRRNIAHSLGWCDHKTEAFIVKRVENDDDMWQAVPEALSAGIEQSRLSTAYRFLTESEEEHYTNHFIVTAGDAADIDKLAEYGEVRIFRK